MKSVSVHIRSSGEAKTIGSILCEEIDCNRRQVAMNPEWTENDKVGIAKVLDSERATIDALTVLGSAKDSVKGEDAMRAAYPGYRQKAVDAITLRNDGSLRLSEVKYLIRMGGSGPFRAPALFRRRIADKFIDMAQKMVSDGEQLDPMRLIIVSEEQLPLSIGHVRGLLMAAHEPGSFASDGERHKYILCSASGLAQIIGGQLGKLKNGDDYLEFEL